jgi:MSHA biogenesis protein MshG
MALSLLLKAQVDLLQALPLALQTLSNRFIQKRLCGCADALLSGKTFSQALQEARGFLSPSFLNAVKVGETTNTLPQILAVFSTNWHKELQLSLQRFSERLSTSLTSLAGFLLTGLLLGLFYPLYDYIGQVDF